MPGRAVVPECERTLAPMKAAGELRAYRVGVEIFEQWARLLLGPAVEAHGKAWVDVESLAAGVGMADDDGMDGVLRRQFRIADASLQIAATGVGLGAKDVAARMQRLQPLERRLQYIG